MACWSVLAVVAGLYVQQALALFVGPQPGRPAAGARPRLPKQNRQLAQQQALNNPATILQDARALGMVRPGERPYVVTGLPGD